MRGKLLLGTVGAVVGALIGAIAWAAITAATSFQIGYMAVGVGFLAGVGMRQLSGGRERADGVVAGAVALLGCVMGNLLTAVIVIAQHQHYPIFAVLGAVLRTPAFAADLIREGFNILDLLFYAIAMYVGYRTALKPAAAVVPSQEPAP